MFALIMKIRQRGYTLMEVLIVATIVGILVTVGTVQYLEVKRRSKEKLAVQRLAQLAVFERMYFRDFGNYATFEDLRIEGYIDESYLYQSDEPLHYHRPAYVPEYQLEFNLEQGGLGFEIVATGVLDEPHTWYPRWVPLGGIPDLRAFFVEEDGVVKWLDTGRPVY